MPSETRYQIFISSTFNDLEIERKEVIETIVDIGHIPIALERFSASNESDLQVINKTISQSHIFLILIGHRYGELIPGKEISFTELEYNLAKENRLLILPILLKDDDVNNLRSELKDTIDKDRKEILNHDKFWEFRKKISQFRTYWKKGQSIKFKVAMAIYENIQNCTKPGFVDASKSKDLSFLESAAKNDFIRDSVARLESFTKLHRRCLINKDLKEELAITFVKYIWID